MTGPITVFVCGVKPEKTVKVQVNADQKLFESFKKELSKEDISTDVAFRRFMIWFLNERSKEE